MTKISIIRNFAATIAVCFIAAIMIQVSVLADDSEEFSIEQGNATYEFLRELKDADVDNITISYPDGTDVSEGMRNNFLQKLANDDFDGLTDLIFNYHLFLLVMEEGSLSAGNINISHVYNFFRPFSRLMQADRRPNDQTVLIRFALRGSVTFNHDGTVSPNGRPIVTLEDAWLGEEWSFTIQNPNHTAERLNNNLSVRFTGQGRVEGRFGLHTGERVNFGNFEYIYNVS